MEFHTGRCCGASGSVALASGMAYTRPFGWTGDIECVPCRRNVLPCGNRRIARHYAFPGHRPGTAGAACTIDSCRCHTANRIGDAGTCSRLMVLDHLGIHHLDDRFRRGAVTIRDRAGPHMADNTPGVADHRLGMDGALTALQHAVRIDPSCAAIHQRRRHRTIDVGHDQTGCTAPFRRYRLAG